MATRNVHVILHIGAAEYLEYYSGAARHVATTASNGLRVKFPANILRPFITRDGIHGEFVIEFDHHNKFVAIKKI